MDYIDIILIVLVVLIGTLYFMRRKSRKQKDTRH